MDTPRLHTDFLYSMPDMFHTSLTTNLICDKDAHTALAEHIQNIFLKFSSTVNSGHTLAFTHGSMCAVTTNLME